LPEFGRCFDTNSPGNDIPARFNDAIQTNAEHQGPVMRHADTDTSSIRDHLESEARRLYPNLHRRLARRQTPPARRSLRWQDRTLLIIASVLMLALLLRGETAVAQELPEYGIEWSGGVQTAVNTQIGIEITGMVARAEVTQIFVNQGAGWAEAVYRFPLPDGAAVDRLLIEVGSRVLVGEIHEKATLVEQQRPNQFETKIANIGPGEEVRITIGFLSTVTYRDGEFSFRFPMTFTPRGGGQNRQFEFETAPKPMLTSMSAPAFRNTDHQLDLGISLQTGLVLSRIDSLYHDVDIHPTLDGYHIFLTEHLSRTDRIFELNWVPELGSAPESSLTTWDDGDSVYALLMLAPPLGEEVAPQPREVIFIIDTSGSMEGESIQQARTALLRGLSFLEGNDLFNIIQFNSSHEQLFRNSVMPMTAELEIAAEYIEGLAANGGTNMGPALHAAMTLPASPAHLRQIIFITDGSVGNEHDLLLQIGEELGDSRLFTVSIGSAPNTWFMNKSSIVGRGSHTHIGRLDSVESAMAGLWKHIQSPALMDICVDWGMDAEYFPEIIPDLYAGEPLWLYARLPTQPRQVTICGLLADSPWEQQTQPRPGNGSDTLATLWARSKIESLEDSRLFGTDPQWIRERVTDIALDYQLLTAYTSLVAVDKTPARPVNEHLRRDNVPSLVPAGSSGNATGFTATAAGWKLQLLLSALTLAIASGLFFFGTGQLRSRLPMAPSTPPFRVADTA
jgi:Ca-activated chloride channel family protein